MPFDAILLGSRMMIAREAETSFEVKKLIAETPGCADADWTRSYQQDVGGVITVTSEMGQPIHKIANRGVRLWAELDKTVFSLSATDRIKALKTKSSYIKDRLCKDYQKPWFATIDDRMVELEEMSYMQVIQRMVELMYVSHQHRWIDATYKRSTYDFICQALSRFSDQSINLEVLDQPGIFLERLASLVPELSKNMVSPQDVLFFLHLCKTPGRKPVNFVPRLNEDFEYFFKKDSLWQAEDLDAVVGRDAGRVCILQGPVAARYSTSADQSTEEILQNINKGFINRLRRDGLVGQDEQVSFRVNWEHVEACHCVCTSMDVNEDNIDVWFPSSKDLPDDAPWMDFLKSFSPPWLIALLTSSAIARGSRRTKNNIPRLFAARQGQRFLFRGLENNAITTVSIEKDDRSGQDRQELLLLSWDASQHYQITLKLFEHLTTNGQPAILTFRFRYDDSNLTCPISERVKDRNLSTKKFYGQLWASNNPSHIITDDAAFLEFIGKETRLTEGTLSRFVSCIDPKLAFGRNSHLPMDFGIVIAWDVLVQPLLLPAIDGDLLRLVHLSNEFRQFPNVAPLQVGDTVKAISHITAVQIQEPGKIVEVTALIKKSNIPILEIKSSFLFQGRYTDFDRTFRLIQNPSYVLDVKNKTIEALLRDREWFVPDSIDEALLGSKLHFETTTKVRYADKSTYAAIETSGTILKLDQNGELDKIGSVLFAEGQCTGNPVVEFLERHGRPCGSQIEFQSAVPLGEGAELVFTAPASNNSYSKFSGDFNPIHVSPLFAAYADLPGTITHGMFTSARVRQLVREQIFGADEDLFRRYSVSFTGMVLPGDAIEVQVLHTAMLDGQKVLKITATHGITGETVLKAEAEVEEKQSAYLFTGQGSQAPDMGMDLYATSEICRSLWDRADTHTHKTFGKTRMNWFGCIFRMN
jgi:fatty acid synthase subunit beta